MAEEAEAALRGGAGDLGRGGAQHLLRRRVLGTHFARGGALACRWRGRKREVEREQGGAGWCVLRPAAAGEVRRMGKR